MNTSKPAKSAPLAATSAVRKATSSKKPVQRSRPLHRVDACEPCSYAISLLELDCDPADIAQLFADDLHYRIQTRGYFWGYFD